jgi:hypothetical protein
MTAVLVVAFILNIRQHSHTAPPSEHTHPESAYPAGPIAAARTSSPASAPAIE